MKIAGYLRVSSLQQVEQFSLAAQREAILRYCTAHGWAEPDWFEDAGISAHTDDPAARPAFARLLAAVERGDYTLVIVHSLDRWARSVTVCLSTLRRFEERGCEFVSINQRMNFTGPFGRAVLGVLAIFAQLHSDNLSQESKKGLAEKKRQGLHVGRVPYGAQRVDGRLVIDPATAPTLARILTALTSGQSPQRVADALNAEGIPAPSGGLWHQSTIHLMVRAGSVHGQPRPATASWLLDQPAPWPALYQTAHTTPHRLPVQHHHHPLMLGGLMRCACGGVIGYHLTVQHKRRGGYITRYGRCRNNTQPGRRGCTSWARTMTQLEGLVTNWLMALPDPRREVPSESGDELATRYEGQRQRLVELYRDGLLDANEYQTERARLLKLANRLPATSTSREMIGTGLARAQAAWAGWDDEARNSFLRGLATHILVDHGTITVHLRPQYATLWSEADLHWPRSDEAPMEA